MEAIAYIVILGLVVGIAFPVIGYDPDQEPFNLMAKVCVLGVGAMASTFILLMAL